MQASSENRSITRIPCVISISDRGRSAPLGLVQNLSLDGMFVHTAAPLVEGSVVPAAFTLGAEGPEIRPEAEVVRRTPEGMGMRFLNMSRQDSRRLRRYLGELSNVIARRSVASGRLEDTAGRMGAPIADPARIRSLLEQSAKSSSYVAIPEQRVLRETASLLEVGSDTLRFATKGLCELTVGEMVFVLYTHEFVSYSFPTRVTAVEARAFVVAMPELLHYSERRAASRGPIAEREELEVAVPWRNHEKMCWQVLESSPTGLSFRAAPDEVYFWPGTVVPQATLRRAGAETVLDRLVVKHVTSMRDEQDRPWVKVGLALDVARQAPSARAEELAIASSKGHLNQVVSWGRDLAAKASYVFHSRVRRLQQDAVAASEVVRFNNRARQPVVGLLNRSFTEKGRVRCPLVIIAPGFGARKETVGALALTITDNFRRQHRDVAVLRWDGTNNLGESHKDPGCDGEGRHCMHYTVSGGIDDLMGVLAWARSNGQVDPTDIIVVSVSFSSVAVRRALTTPDTAAISRWISFMGVPDAQNALVNVAGGTDGYGMHLAGNKIGDVSLLGCLVDCDQMCADMKALGVATLEDARRDMAAIRADVTWFIGKHDAFMDPRRVRDVMSIKAPGKREIIEVSAGHVPQSSDEALAEFTVMTRHIWRHLYGSDLDAVVPSRGWLAAENEREWQRVRNPSLGDAQQYWHDYLLGEGGLGFDVWSFTPEYRQLMDDQVRLLAPHGKRVLDLGAGTGNFSAAIASAGPASLVAVDLVGEALERAAQKVDGRAGFRTVTASADGNERIAMARLLRGELASFAQVAQRLPASHRPAGEALAGHYTQDIHALLRGAPIDADQALRAAGVPTSHLAACRDILTLGPLALGLTSLAEAEARADASFHASLERARGLPFDSGAFDCVGSSLVMSYMVYPDDYLSEVMRVLAPGGTFVLSSMVPDADISRTFVDNIARVDALTDADMPPGYTRETLKAAMRRIVDNGANLQRLSEEGVFTFWDGKALAALVARAGFVDIETVPSSGDPAQAVIVKCRRR